MPLTSGEIFEKDRLTERHNQFRFRKFILPTPQLIHAIQWEWFAQVAKVVDHGIMVSHLGAHQHVHMRLWIFPVLKFENA
jgi:predicted glycoside hydrolase/deacetylase ChbG (UPF0249 family)